MAEYIEREALLKDAHDYVPIPFIPNVEHLIERQPAADVDPVVRCKECLYRSQYANKDGFYKCGAIQCKEGHCAMVPPEFACIAGKRRTD